MEKYISKSAVVAEMERRIYLFKKEKKTEKWSVGASRINVVSLGARIAMLEEILSFLDTLEEKNPYEQCVQYDSIKAGIQAHAETYSFNIESKLFNQLTKEQQELWREEIEQACISGGEAGVELARDMRYKENLEVKEVDLEKEIKRFTMSKELFEADSVIKAVAKHFFELGLNSQTKDMKEALRTEYEKGRADVLRLIDPDEMVADFCSQPFSKTRSIASIYRQGIIDIIKRINNNEETSTGRAHLHGRSD